MFLGNSEAEAKDASAPTAKHKYEDLDIVYLN